MDMKKYIYLGIMIFALAVIILFIFWSGAIMELFTRTESSQQAFSVLISAAAAAAIVGVMQVFLMKQQENKDKNIRIYEKKLEVYSRFNALLWKCSDPSSFEKVADMCMQELIFSISNDKVKNLATLLNEAKKNCETIDKAKESYAAITNLLKSDLLDTAIEEVKNKDILNVFNAVNIPEEDVISENIQSVSTDAIEWKSNEIKDIWNNYESGQLQCWHFNALEVEKQKWALDSDNKILSLIEYNEEWRTERLKQVKDGDVVFLFNRGGAGYVGMYRALGTIVLRNDDRGVYISEDGKTEILISKEDANKYDIYSAIGDGASFVSNIKV